MTALAVLAALAAGYGLGRYRPAHRASDWANWQRYDQRPTGPRYWAMYAVLSAENIGWLIAHPVKGWHAWQHRNDPPPPPLGPPVRIRETPATEADGVPQRGTRLCHDTDPTTLKECALKAGHPGNHADADVRWDPTR